MYDAERYYDLTQPEGSELRVEIEELGEAGIFIKALVERARAEGKPLMIKELSGTPTIQYEGDEVKLLPRISTDADEMSPTHMHFAMHMLAYKKPWINSILAGQNTSKWLELQVPSSAQLCQELLGETLLISDLAKRFPQPSESDIRNSIARSFKARLKGIFRVVNFVGNHGLEVRFVTEEAKQKYLNNDPAFMEMLKGEFKVIFSSDLEGYEK